MKNERPSLLMSTLATLCNLVTDGTHDTPAPVADGYPLIKAKEIVGGRIDFTNCDRISAEDHEEVIARSKPELGDTLFAHIGASLGEAAFVNTTREFSIKNIALFKPNPKVVDGRYLYYVVIGPEFQASAKAAKTGSAQPFLSLGHLRGHVVRYAADLRLQRKIAGILSAYDELIEVNTRRIAILEEMARRLFDEWFIKRRFPGGGRPKEAEEVPLRAVADFAKGRKPEETKQVASQGDIPLLLIDALRGGSPVFTSPVGVVLVEKRDTIMVMDGGSSCDVVLGFSGALGSTLGRFRTIDRARFSNHALYRFLESRVDEFKLKNIGSAIPHANKDYILQQPVKLLPRAANEKLDSLLEPAQVMVEVLRSTNQRLRAARDLLLPKLISGEIDVSGAEHQTKHAVKRAAAE